MLRRQSALILGGALLGLTLTVTTANAWMYGSHTATLSFSGPITLPGVTLGAGTYIFDLASPRSNLSLVRVMSQDQKHLYYLGFTLPVVRPANLQPDGQISFVEVAPGIAKPIKAWFPIGESTGHQFIYDR